MFLMCSSSVPHDFDEEQNNGYEYNIDYFLSIFSFL